MNYRILSLVVILDRFQFPPALITSFLIPGERGAALRTSPALFLILYPILDPFFFDNVHIPEDDFRVGQKVFQSARYIPFPSLHFGTGIFRTFDAGFHALSAGTDADCTPLAALEQDLALATLTNHFCFLQMSPETLREVLPSGRDARLQADPVEVQDIARAAEQSAVGVRSKGGYFISPSSAGSGQMPPPARPTLSGLSPFCSPAARPSPSLSTPCR